MPHADFTIRDTSHLSIAQLAAATNATFTDYFVSITHTTDGFAAFCRANSVDLARSVLLERASDGRLAGLTMLAVRAAQGWCGGFGLTPEFRGQGLAAVLLQALVAQARHQGLATLRLEVLTQNERALKTYARAGFRSERELVILTGSLDPDMTPAEAGLDIRSAHSPLAAWIAGLALPVPAPCWQREIVSLLTTADLQSLIATRAGTVVGVLLSRANPSTGLLLVGHLAFEDEATARALLAHAAAETQSTHLFVQNEPDGSPLHALCRTLGLRELHRQHEMNLAL